MNASTLASINSAPPPPPAAPSLQPLPGQSARLYDRNFPSLGPAKPAAAPSAAGPSAAAQNNPKWKKKSSVTIPMSNSWSNSNNNAAQSSDNETPSYNLAITTKSKKKKKKGAKGNEAPKMANGTETSSASSPPNESNKKAPVAEEPPKKSPEHSKSGKSKVSAANGGEVPSTSQERKRSELEIDNLELKSGAQSAAGGESGPAPTDRLLSLIRGDSASATKSGPPGFERPVQPPPGFAVPGPPPGFEANSKAPLSNGLTFTNSSGESYPIQPFPSAQYVQPANFPGRNAGLKAKVAEALASSGSGNPKTDFMEMSVMFRAGLLPAKLYYDYCKVSMGEKAFNQIFPELICLLPDISKQQVSLFGSTPVKFPDFIFTEISINRFGISLHPLMVSSCSCHKRQKAQAPIRNRQTRKVANAKARNRNTNLT